MCQQHPQFGPKGKEVSSTIKIERFFTKAIPAQEHLAAAPIQDNKSPHPVQMVDHIRPPSLVALDHNFRVGMVGQKDMPGRSKVLPQFGMVLDLSVEND